MDYILELEQVSKTFNKTIKAVQDCSFKLESKKICAIVGASGCGKSTLLRLIAGLEQPEQGRIKIQGQVVTDTLKFVRPQQRNVGMVFQNYALFPHLTVAQNIRFGLKKEDNKDISKLMEIINLKGYEKSYPGMLSGGQEQRVAIARALAMQPKLLLLDEPFSNLDAGLKTSLRQEIRKIIKHFGTSMIFITHDIYDALDIADEVMYMQDGKIIQQANKTDFFQNNNHPQVQSELEDLRHNANQLLHYLEGKQ